MADKKGKKTARKPRKVKVTLKQDEKKDGWNFMDILKTFVPLLGIFAAFCYILGRSYLESYYHALGITPSVLVFTTNDYMFSSIKLVIACIFIAGLFVFYWELSKRNTSILFDEDAPAKQKPFRITALVIFVILVVSSIVYLILSASDNSLKNIWAVCGASVIILVIGLIFYIDIVHWKLPLDKTKTLRDHNAVRVISAIVISLLVFIITMVPVDLLAQTQAADDTDHYFSSVDVICNKPLPQQFVGCASANTCVANGRLILTNNGITYIRSEKDSDPWIVYAIPVTSIDSIMYMPPRPYQHDKIAK